MRVGTNLVVDLVGPVDPGEFVLVHTVLQNEVERVLLDHINLHHRQASSPPRIPRVVQLLHRQGGFCHLVGNAAVGYMEYRVGLGEYLLINSSVQISGEAICLIFIKAARILWNRTWRGELSRELWRSPTRNE